MKRNPTNLDFFCFKLMTASKGRGKREAFVKTERSGRVAPAGDKSRLSF